MGTSRTRARCGPSPFHQFPDSRLPGVDDRSSSRPTAFRRSVLPATSVARWDAHLPGLRQRSGARLFLLRAEPLGRGRLGPSSSLRMKLFHRLIDRQWKSVGDWKALGSFTAPLRVEGQAARREVASRPVRVPCPAPQRPARLSGRSGAVGCGPVAQLAERLLCKQEVVGSNPIGSTSGRQAFRATTLRYSLSKSTPPSVASLRRAISCSTSAIIAS